MGVVTRSLWLPVGRANFFSTMTDPILLLSEGGVLSGQCRSSRLEQDPSYIPFLRESVFRRLLEVLPASFGYEPTGVCEFSGEADDRFRPVSLTMTLRPPAATPGLAHATATNQAMSEAGITSVTLRVDELGFYSFTAAFAGLEVSQALEEHVIAVFGADFEVNRLEPSPDRRSSEGVEAVRRYNGLAGTRPTDDRPEVAQSPPLGALSFFQLNLMVEGLCNQSLLPAVFFEHYAQSKQWLDEYRRQSSVLTHLNDFVRETTVAADAATPTGQMTALYRALTISRGSLQWMRRSVESTRRSLLDQMMAVSHRQARLIQLDLSGVGYERTPEMTGEATESQMRGYVMLVATKLPLLYTVADGATEALAAIRDDRTAQFTELDTLVSTWIALLDRLRVNVGSLETAVEHDWQERLLYEQEQARSEQEAMAEIERSRRGRPESQRMSEAAYNAIMVILTAVAVFAAIQATEVSTNNDASLWQQAVKLWPAVLAAALIFLVWPIVAGLRRLQRQSTPSSDTYSFEFAFRLDEHAEQESVGGYLEQNRSEKIRSKTFGVIKIRRLGGWRIERLSTDTTLLKVHSVAVIRLAWLRYARCEIVTEIMARRISDNQQFFVRQCRMFGDSPIPLLSQQVLDLVRELLLHTCAPLVPDFDINEMTDALDPLRSQTPPVRM